jgi:hypothetical protein
MFLDAANKKFLILNINMFLKNTKPMKTAYCFLARYMFLLLLFVLLHSGQAVNSAPTNMSLITTAENFKDMPLLSLLQDTTKAKPLDKEARKAVKKQEKEAKKALAREEAKIRNQPIPNPNHADYIILGKSLPEGRTLLESISGRVPGMMIQGTNVMTRGPSSFTSRGEPLFLIDGVPAPLETANNISIAEIERIEIFTGAGTAMYGTRGSNGVISVIRKLSAQ